MDQLFETEARVAVAGYANVAPEQGVDAGPEGLTYAIPENLADLGVGDRVLVPLGRGNKQVPGYVTAVMDEDEAGLGAKVRIKPIAARDPLGLSLTPDLIDLARWLAGYYCCPLGMVFATMLPAAVKRGTGMVDRTMVGLADQPAEGGEEPPPKLTRLQKAVMETARSLGEEGKLPVEIKDLAGRAGARSPAAVLRLIEKGLLTSRRDSWIATDAYESPGDGQGSADGTAPEPFELTPDQRSALDHLVGHVGGGFSVHVLLGVTGSGKTEVYLRLIQHLREQAGGGAQPGVIVLVPEIALTPQAVTRFEERFDDVAVLHSGLTAAQRHQQWRRINTGRASIVVGARSAVFAPIPGGPGDGLGGVKMIIVDEEHDTSYKQDQLPRYHARDVAIKRAQILGIPVVLGSATPSLESYHHAKEAGAGSKSAYHLVRLRERVCGFQMPKVHVVDMAEQRRVRRGMHWLSQPLERALDRTLRGKGQAMLLINRRGYANYISCPDTSCGWLQHCDDCDVMMVYHKDRSLSIGGNIRCHHCHAEQLLPSHCPQCGERVTVFGMGTQRIEEEVIEKFPSTRLARMDSDTMNTARDYHDRLSAFGAGEIDVLVGTQMIAKGLDYPNVRLVGVISCDTALHLPDFRSSERTFQLIAQVAGRAGRSSQPAEVYAQTFSPDDPAIELASQHDFEGFADREIELRKQISLPPCARLARIIVRDEDFDACVRYAAELAKHLTVFNDDTGGAVRIHGPMPCPIARIAGYHRQQIELAAETASAIQALLTGLRNSRLLRSDARTAVDVDPVALL